MELETLNILTQTKSLLSVNDKIFAKDYNEPLVHQVVVAFMANARVATRAQKSRGTVSHTTAKPWKQKGTGRARSGMSSSPIWRGGGRTFPNSPFENFTHKVNRKMYKGCIASLLSEAIRSKRFFVVDELSLKEPKTKSALVMLSGLGVANSLVVVHEFEEALYLAMRNLKDHLLVHVDSLDPVAILKYDQIVITKQALEKLNEVLV
jgi:large subunit ribosomal protein L4